MLGFSKDPKDQKQNPIAKIIFMSRWLQAPLYLGLILALALYAWHFLVEVFHLFGKIHGLTEVELMMAVLGLVDIVLISNLMVMVIMGGYETFVSRLNITGHPDEPEWLDHVSAGNLKIKLSLTLISISAINLLRAFISVEQMTDKALLWQVVIHFTFVFSALAIALIDRMGHAGPGRKGI